MPWGISRRAIAPALQGWAPGASGVVFLDYRPPRGSGQLFDTMTRHIAAIHDETPSLAQVTLATLPTTRVGMTVLPRLAKARGETVNNAIVGADPMNSITQETDSADTLGSVLAAVRRNADQTKDLTVAASHVVARRVALGVAGALNPSSTDHAEFARMVPEKVAAFSAANRIMLSQSGLLAREMSRLASEEVHVSARATLAMAGCASPVALATAGSEFMMAWFNRAATNFIALGMMTLGVQDAAMAPVRQQVAVNIERLG